MAGGRIDQKKISLNHVKDSKAYTSKRVTISSSVSSQKEIKRSVNINVEPLLQSSSQQFSKNSQAEVVKSPTNVMEFDLRIDEKCSQDEQSLRMNPSATNNYGTGFSLNPHRTAVGLNESKMSQKNLLTEAANNL